VGAEKKREHDSKNRKEFPVRGKFAPPTTQIPSGRKGNESSDSYAIYRRDEKLDCKKESKEKKAQMTAQQAGKDLVQGRELLSNGSEEKRASKALGKITSFKKIWKKNKGAWREGGKGTVCGKTKGLSKRQCIWKEGTLLANKGGKRGNGDGRDRG